MTVAFVPQDLDVRSVASPVRFTRDLNTVSCVSDVVESLHPGFKVYLVDGLREVLNKYTDNNIDDTGIYQYFILLQQNEELLSIDAEMHPTKFDDDIKEAVITVAVKDTKTGTQKTMSATQIFGTLDSLFDGELLFPLFNFHAGANIDPFGDCLVTTSIDTDGVVMHSAVNFVAKPQVAVDSGFLLGSDDDSVN